MRRIDAPASALPLFDVAHGRALEARALAALPPHTLMRRAGWAVARLALALAPHARTVRIAAGPGNNGGDGFEAALHLQAAGRRVEVLRVGDTRGADALDALARARGAGVCIDPPAPTPLDAHDLAIDALLGIGASRAPEGALADAIRGLADLPCPVLAIDLPSGLDADTGQAFGADCVGAAHTLALLALKPGLFTAAGRDRSGTVWFDALGVEAAGEPPQAWLGAARPAALPPRRHAQHKGSFGDVVVVGGAAGMTGAAWLAARSALAAGAGRVYVDLLDGGSADHDPERPELMLRRGWSVHAPQSALAASTVVCGCGGADAVRAVLPRLLSGVPRLLLDADALNAIAADEALGTLLRARAARGQATVLTPHPLEAARLLGIGSAQVQADRLAAARRLAERFAAVVLLKGSGTLVAAPGDAPVVNPSGNPALASPGTGDVLAGWIAGHWAQRADADAGSRAMSAALHSAWLHGAAADACGAPVLRASLLIERMAVLEQC